MYDSPKKGVKNMKIKFVLILFFITLLAFGCSKEKKTEKPEWRGKIDYENGVKVVKNPEGPVYGEIIFDLEEDLSIGNESDENYMFYRTGAIATDSQGNIYIVDSGNNRIQKFRNDGSIFKRSEEKGRGPVSLRALMISGWIQKKTSIFQRE